MDQQKKIIGSELSHNYLPSQFAVFDVLDRLVIASADCSNPFEPIEFVALRNWLCNTNEYHNSVAVVATTRPTPYNQRGRSMSKPLFLGTTQAACEGTNTVAIVVDEGTNRHCWMVLNERIDCWMECRGTTNPDLDFFEASIFITAPIFRQKLMPPKKSERGSVPSLTVSDPYYILILSNVFLQPSY